MSAQSRPILTLSVASAAAFGANLFVTYTGALPIAGARCMGVTRTQSTAAGQMLPVDVIGTSTAIAGAAFSAGSQLEVDAAGQLVPHASGSVVAVALEDANAAGTAVEVLLIPN